jgi:hypothetical protein
MYHEVVSKRVGVDSKGRDREFQEKFLVENKEFCAEAEVMVRELFNYENEVTSVRQSKIYEFANEREDDDQFIYLSTIEATFINEDDGSEKVTKYVVGVFAMSVEEATSISKEYMKQGLTDMTLTSVKKTNFIELLK